MPGSADFKKSRGVTQRFKQSLVPRRFCSWPEGCCSQIAGNWNTWASERAAQTTDDAYVRAGLTDQAYGSGRRQFVKLRQESERLAQNQLTQGVVLVSQRRQRNAATYKAQADYLQASLGYLLAWAELEQAVGRTPGI